MGREFEIVVERPLPGTPEQVWDAVTAQTSAWLFPDDGALGEEVVYERPAHRVNRMEGPDGWFNQLDQVITARPEGGSRLRWAHSGVFAEDFDTQYAAASKHTVFYLHTLAEYLEHFAPRPAVFADIQGPDSSMGPDAFERVRSALGIRSGTAAGEPVTADLPGMPSGAIVDWQDELFVGLRTDDALYRFFGRNAFGGPVGITVHHFGEASAEELQETWRGWLDAVFAA